MSDAEWQKVEDRWERRGLWIARHPIATAIIAVLLLVGLGIGGWAAQVAWSGPKGAGDAYQQKNGATNRIEAQASYHTTFESIKALDEKLTDAQVQLDAYKKAQPSAASIAPFGDEMLADLQRTVTGLQQQCRNAVADYDASTEKYLLRDFRDTDLPYKIDQGDPLFQNGQARWSDYDCTVTPEETR